MRNLLLPTLSSVILATLAAGVLLGSKFILIPTIVRQGTDFWTNALWSTMMFFPLLLVAATVLTESARNWANSVNCRLVVWGILGLSIIWLAENVVQYLFLTGSIPGSFRSSLFGWPRVIATEITRAICFWLMASPLSSLVLPNAKNTQQHNARME